MVSVIWLTCSGLREGYQAPMEQDALQVARLERHHFGLFWFVISVIQPALLGAARRRPRTVQRAPGTSVKQELNRKDPKRNISSESIKFSFVLVDHVSISFFS